MIKVKICEDYATMSHCIFIYRENTDGSRTFAKPVELVFDIEEPIPGSMAIAPVIKIPARPFEVAIENSIPIPSKQMLEQKEKDKNMHIQSLEQILHNCMETRL